MGHDVDVVASELYAFRNAYGNHLVLMQSHRGGRLGDVGISAFGDFLTLLLRKRHRLDMVAIE